MPEIVISLEFPDDTSPTGYYPLTIVSAPSLEAAKRYISKPPRDVADKLKEKRDSGIVLVAREGNELELPEFGTAIDASLYDGKRISLISCKNTRIPEDMENSIKECLNIRKVGVDWVSTLFNAEDPYYIKLFLDRLKLGFRTFKYNHAIEMMLEVSNYTNTLAEGALIRELVDQIKSANTTEEIEAIYSSLFTPKTPSAGIYVRPVCYTKKHIMNKVPMGTRGATHWADGVHKITTEYFTQNIFKKMSSDMLRKNIPKTEVLLAAHAMSKRELR